MLCCWSSAPCWFVPAVMPVLPPDLYARVFNTSDSAGSQQSAGNINGLPQNLADRFGWESQMALTTKAYHSLPATEQWVPCIFTTDYGEVGATPSLSGGPQGAPVRS